MLSNRSLTVINPNKDYTAPFLLPKDNGAMIIAGYSKVEIYISAFYSHTVTCYDATGSSLGSFSDGTLQTWHDIKGQLPSGTASITVRGSGSGTFFSLTP